MMKRFKRFLSLFCTVTMLTGMADCYADLPGNGPDEPQAAAAEQAEVSVPEPAAPPAPEPEPEPEKPAPKQEAAEQKAPERKQEASSAEESAPKQKPPENKAPEQKQEAPSADAASPKQNAPDNNAPEQKQETVPQESPAGGEASQPKESAEEQPSAPERQEPQPASAEGGPKDTGAEDASSPEPEPGPSADQPADGEPVPGGTAPSDGPAEQGGAPEGGNNEPGGEADAPKEGGASAEMNPGDADRKNPENPQAGGEDPEDITELPIGGNPVLAAASPEKPARLLIRSKKAGKLLLTVLLTAGDQIFPAVEDVPLNPVSTAADGDSDKQRLVYELNTEAGSSCLLVIAAPKATEFSIQAAREAKASPKDEKPAPAKPAEDAGSAEEPGAAQEAAGEPGSDDPEENPADGPESAAQEQTGVQEPGEPGENPEGDSEENPDEGGDVPEGEPGDPEENPEGKNPEEDPENVNPDENPEEDPEGDNPEETPDEGEDAPEGEPGDPEEDPEGENPEENPEEEADGPDEEAEPFSESGTLTASASDCTVTVRYGADALFPEDVTLTVEEVLPGTARYAELTGLTEEMLTNDWVEAGAFQRVFDITFRSGDEEIEPAAAIQVDFRFSDPVSLEDNSSLQVVHVDQQNNAEIVPADASAAPAGAAVDGISFASDSFSAYVVFQTREIVSKTIEDEDHIVSITYGRANGIPENSQVLVTVIEEGTESHEAFRRRLIQQLNLDEKRQTVLFSALYDITLLDENDSEVPIRDNTTVTVTAELPADAAREDVMVIHFDGSGDGASELDATARASVVTFETDGFSVYGFAYTVDYAYQGSEYCMQGGGSITLSELFTLLDIPESAADAEKAVFSNPALIRVERAEGDWLLTSLRPFMTEEALTVTLSDGRMILITVTDAPTDPWYIQDGELHIMSDAAMNFTRAANAPWYSRRNEITSIIIENGVTKIPQNFTYTNTSTENYPNLKSVTVADSVNTMGSNAFCNCKSLESVTLGAGLTSLPQYAFRYCSALKSIDLQHVTSMSTYCFYGCSSLEEAVLGEGLQTLPAYTFQNCSSLKSIDLKNVKTINSSCFSGCSALAEVTQDGELRTVAYSAFDNCRALQSIDLTGVTSLGSSCFYNCTALKEVILDENLKTVQGSTFQNAKALETINLENVENFDSYCFSGCTALKNADLSSAKAIGSYAFQNCTGLTGAVTGDALKTIGECAFYGCSGLKEIDLSSATAIQNYAFYNCTGLTEAVLGDSLKTIGSYAFYNCDSLTGVDIPASVESIGSSAFASCDKLESVYFDPLNRMTTLSGSVFSACPKLRDVVLPQDLYIIPSSMFSGCKSLETVEMPASLSIIDTYAFDGCSALTDAALPSYVKEIRNYAFRNCTNLEDPVFPETLEKIGESAYQNCDALTDVTLPASLTSIGNLAFSDCAKLESADLSRCAATTVPDYCFRNDPQLESVLLPKNLTKIGASAFNNDPKLSEINLPETLTEIGNSAFSQCTSLSVINDGAPGVLEVPENVTRIGTSAFNQCNSLTEAYISDSVTDLGSSAFANCANLEKAVVGKGVTQLNPSVFYNDPKLKSITFESELITKIPNDAFNGCRSLEEFPFWEGLREIGTGAFLNCTSLKSLEFPSTLEKIADGGSGSFAGCTGLKEVVFKDGEKDLNIGNYAFYQDRNLTSVKFPENLTRIGSYAFGAYGSSTSYTMNLANVEFPENCRLTEIASGAFYNTKIRELDLPDNVKTIGDSAFYYCRELESVDLPDGLKSIGATAFRYCSKLKTVSVPDSVTSIGSGAFRNCSALTEAKLPKNLETINNNVFTSCSSLAKVEMPETLKTIGSSAFSSCGALKEIDLPATLTSIGNSAFNSCGSLAKVNLPADSQLASIGTSAFSSNYALKEINLPDTVTSIGSSAFSNCTGLTKAELSENLKTLENSVFQSCTSLKEVDMPDKLETIGNNTFYGCSSLKEADLPATLTSIGNSAFYGCSSMTKVSLPEDSQLKTISPYAFQFCSSLREIDLPDTVTSIGTCAFEGCRDLKTADLSDGLKAIETAVFRNCQNLTDIDLHQVETIGEESFKGCVALGEIDLPDTLKTISKNAFNGCGSLQTLDIPSGTTSIGEGAFTGCKGLESMRWNAKDGAIEPFSSGTRFALTVGRDVDNLSAEALTNLFRGGAEEIRFEGGNYLTLPDTRNIADSARGLPRPLNALDAGSYYADENGALYAVRDGQASLVYLPDGLTEYTIPETIPGENGGDPVPVTGVRANALYQAQALTALTIEKPENMTRIESSAFANAANLASVNGETTSAGATALFTHEDLIIGNQVFYHTKLDQEEDTSVAGSLEYTDSEDPEQATLKLTISELGDSRRGDRAGNPKPLGELTTDPGTNAYLAYTGETIKTILQISNPASEEIPDDGQKIRVYIQLDEGGEISKFVAGRDNIIKQTKPSADGFVEADYHVTLVETDVRGVYYFDLDRPQNGFTATIELPVTFKSPQTGGGNAVIWAQYMDGEEAAAKAGKAQPPAGDHHTVNWSTRRDTFPVSKTADSSAPLSVTAAADGRIYVNAHSYRISMHRSNTDSLDVGRDNMAKAVFTDTLTVPEGLVFNETIRQEIRDGKIRYRNDGSYKYVISPSCGEIFRFYAPSNSGFLTPQLSLDADDNLQLQWTILNSNPNYNENGGQIDLPSYVTMTVGGRVFAVEDRTADQTYTLRNEVSVAQHYSYSGVHTETSAAQYRVSSGSAKLEFGKTSTASARRGEYAPFTLQLKSTGVLPVTSTELPRITDDIADDYRRFYIPPEGIWQMFSDAHLGDALTLTVSGAHLYGGADALAKTRQTVTTVSGGTGTTDVSNTGSQLHYSGTHSQEDNIVDTEAVFTFTRVGGEVQVTLSSGGTGTTETVGSAADIRAFMDRHGFFVTQSTAYRAEWDTTRIPGFHIDPGQDWRVTIPTRLKDTFMSLESDDIEYLKLGGDSTRGTYNTAKFDYNGSQTSRSAFTTYANDASLSKGFSYAKSFRYKNDYTDIEIPEVVRYSVSASHSGSAAYGVMPLTDHMTLRQQLLVPVSRNQGKAWAEGLETYALDGVSYYVLKEGEYKDVHTGSAWADHITVADLGQGNYDTKIFWYLDGYRGSSTTTISYLAKVEHNPFVPLQKAFDIHNESWLGDHEAHRLWDSVSNGEYVEGEPLVTSYGKKIVGYVGDTSEGRDFSFVARGNEVIYRLSFASDLHQDFTVNGTQFYDMLPAFSPAFSWSKDTVSLTYWNFTTNDPEDVKWQIIPDENNPNTRQRIRWDDDFEMTCSSETGRAYIYVTLKFPSDVLWDDYVRTHQGGSLNNTFYIKRNWLNWSSAVVRHELADTAQVRLQKGVYATGGVNDENVDIYRTGGDSRLTYENNDVMKRKVYYYITLHNGGYTNLYLNDIQDVLPRGFTLAPPSKAAASDRSPQSTPRIVSGSYAAVTDANGRGVSYLSASSSSLTARTENAGDGRQRVVMTLRPGAYTGDGTSHFNPYLDGGRYFLRPGEAVVIRLDCYTNEYASTDDNAENAAVMPYYDFYGQGLILDDSTATSGNRASLAEAEKNDGGCEIMDSSYVGAAGFSTAGQTRATQWLYSDVAVRRGEIQPGLSKRLLKTIEVNSDGYEVENLHPGVPHPNDKLVWSVVAENSGSSPLLDYVVSDQMPQPYAFSGDVTFRQIYNSDGEASPEIVLFSVRGRSVVMVGGEKQAGPGMTLVTYAADGAEAASCPLTVDGDPVTLAVPNWRGGNCSIQVSAKTVNGNETMFIRFPDKEMCVLSGGKLVMTFISENVPGVMQNKVFVNRAYITPSAGQQTLWDGLTDEGSITPWAVPNATGAQRSVSSSAQVITSYGSSTSSIKSIHEKADPSNRTNSDQTQNYITLPDKKSVFTYSLSVTNSTYQPIRDLVLIDNLPEVNDHTTFQASDPRDSAFRVLFNEEPAFTLTVRDVLTPNVVRTIDPRYYRVELSRKTDFRPADWSGSASADWTELAAIPAGQRSSYRSARIVFHDDAVGNSSCVFPRNSEITLSFDAVIDGSDPEAQPGRIAWNSFGYQFMDGANPMEAAPLEVGVRIPDLPKVSKTLINSLGKPFAAEQDESFTYVLYKGAPVTVQDGQNPLDAVTAAGRDYATVTVTVPAGGSEAGPVSFNGVPGHYRDGSVYRDGEWLMVNKAAYTLCEIPAEFFMAESFNNRKVQQYQFTYNANSKAFSISSVNRHDDWNLDLRKTDQLSRKLAGAVFAFYTPLENERCMTEAEYRALSLQALNDAFGLALTEKPAYTLESEGTSYALYTLARTDDLGALRLTELMAGAYLCREVQSPGPEYLMDESVRRVERPAASEGAVRTVSVENHYKASGEVTIDAAKQLNGRGLKEGEFRFRLEGYDLVQKRPLTDADPQPPMPAALETANGADGEIRFGPIPLTEANIGETYCYRITEIVPEEDQRPFGVTYDERKIIVKLTVTDGGNGRIDKALTYSMVNEHDEETTLTGDSAKFLNTYRAEASLVLRTRKILEGRAWKASDSFAFQLAGIPDPEDPEAPWDEIILRQTASQARQDPPFVLGYTEQDIGHTYHYRITEEIPRKAAAYHADTGEAVKYKKKDLTYSKYLTLTDEEKAALPPAEKLRWKYNGLVSDTTAFLLQVAVRYDEETGKLKTEALLDGQPLPSGLDAAEPVAFRNVYQADNLEASLPVGKTLRNRPWKRLSKPGDANADPYPDAYRFTLEAEDPAAYTPLPEESGRTVTVVRADMTTLPETQSAKFTIPYRWDDLLADGERLSSRDFCYIIREEIDPEAAGARVTRDESGRITGYVLDQVTYDLSVRRVKITLRDNGSGGLAAQAVYLDSDGNPVDSLVKATDPFVNTYAPEPIDVPIRLSKLVNGIPAPRGSYTFTLYDQSGDPVKENLAIDAGEGGTELEAVIEKLGTEFTSWTDPDRTYTFTLRENIPADALGFRDGKPLGADGNVLAEGGEPLAWADAGDSRADASIVWKKDGMRYDAAPVTVTVTLSMDQLQYRLGATVAYSPAPASGESEAVFENHYEAEGSGVLSVRKTIDGRGFLPGESFTFELTPLEGAPLRTADGVQEKLTVRAESPEAVPFDEMLFSLADLTNPDGSWSDKDFSYTIHEVVPDGASVTDGRAVLLYNDASPEKKKEYDGQWTLDGITFAADRTVTLHVADSRDGTLSVTPGTGLNGDGRADAVNPYAAEGAGVLRVRKTIDGRGFLPGESFTFELTPLEGTPLRTADGDQEKLTVRAESPDAVPFDEMLFRVPDLDNGDGTWSDKNFSYTIHEVVPDGASVTDGGAVLLYQDASAEKKKEYDGQWALDGITYAADRTVTLHVADRGDGSLAVTPGAGLDEEGAADVVNPYAAEGRRTLRVRKAIDGRAFLPDESFTFELTPVGGAPLRTADGDQEKLTLRAGSDGAVSFDELLFSIPDLDNGDGTWSKKEFTYTIHEVVPEGASVAEGRGKLLYAEASGQQQEDLAGKWAFDGIVYAKDQTVTLRVEDDGAGRLTVTPLGTDSADSVSFTNEFRPELITAPIRADKAWLNYDGTTNPPAGAKAALSLFADGEATGRTVELDGGTDAETADGQTDGEYEPWKAVWNDLHVYRRGADGRCIPEGDDYQRIVYTVRETEITLPEDCYASYASDEPEEGAAASGDPASALLTNVQETGSLTVSKKVDTPLAEEENKAFTFRIELSDPTVSGTFDGVPFTDGAAEVTVRGGESLTVTGLPQGLGYTVTEQPDPDFIPDEAVRTGVIGAEEASAEFLNTRKTAEIRVTKVYSGIPQLPEGFVITNDYNQEKFTVKNASGKGTEKDPYVWILSGVPVGLRVVFTESGIQAADYSLTVNGTAVTETSAAVAADAEETEEAPDAKNAKNAAGFVNVYTYQARGSLSLKKIFEFRGGKPEPAPAPPEAGPTPAPEPEPQPEEKIPTTSLAVRKVWDDDGNAAGLRPAQVTMTLSNGTRVVLNEANGWQAVVSGLPLMVDGKPARYSWKESAVPGYTLVRTAVTGGTTIFVNALRQREEPPEGRPVYGSRGTAYLIIEDYGTPLGVECAINHAGDCFD